MTAAPLVPGPVTVRVPAKVNLELLVGPRRADGYHALSTVFHAVSLYDDVTVAVADDWGVSVSGPLADGVPLDAGNLALRAARLVESRFDVELVHRAVGRHARAAAGIDQLAGERGQQQVEHIETLDRGPSPRLGRRRGQHTGSRLGRTGRVGRPEPVVPAGAGGEEGQEPAALRPPGDG